MAPRRKPQGGKLLDPQWRHQRGVTAGAASRASYERRREAEGARFATKGVAYAAGYRRGYQSAFAWWRRKYLRGLRDALRKVVAA